jgi:hypothetical protein
VVGAVASAEQPRERERDFKGDIGSNQRRVMSYAFTQDVPIDAAFYKRIVEQLGPEPPEGLIIHLAIERPEGGLRYLDVWESEAHCERFTEERLHPVVHGLLREIFGDAPPPEPERAPLLVVHAWGRGVGSSG